MLKTLITHLGYWVALAMALGVLRFVGLTDNPNITVVVGEVRLIFFELIIWGAILGLISFVSDRIVEKRRNALSYGRTVVVKSTLMFFGTLLAFVSILVLEDLLPNVEGIGGGRYVLVILKRTTFYIALGYVFVGSILFYTFGIVNKKFGKGMLLKILMGFYREPKEENRIFMFLDLRSSTTIAEKLGNWDFSSLMQRVFLSINMAVKNSNAEIYQYLGDGILMTWPTTASAIKEAIALHFDIQRVIDTEKQEYLKKFKLVPEFKTGIHFGNVTASEIGDIRKEVSYHGDVINTAARIEGYCNTLESDLLISDDLAARVKELKLPYKMKRFDDVELRGKEENQIVWSVEEL